MRAQIVLAVLLGLGSFASARVDPLATTAAVASKPDVKIEAVDVKDLPAKVRDAMAKESAGATLMEVGKRTGKNGKVSYHAVFDRDGKTYAVQVGEDGKAKTKEKKQKKGKK